MKCRHTNICIVNEGRKGDLSPIKMHVECEDCKEILNIRTVTIRYKGKISLLWVDRNYFYGLIAEEE